MADFIVAHEPLIRGGAFLGALLAMAGWEALMPRRPRLVSRWARWPSNLGIAALNTLLLRLVFPAAAIGLAGLGAAHGWGLLNNLPLPAWAGILLGVLLLDL